MMIPILIGCSCIGVILGKLFKNYRIIQPTIIISCVATFCGAGGFVAVNMLPPGARVFANVWVLSYIFEWFNPVLHNFQNNFSLFQYLIIFLVGVVGLGLVYFVFEKKDKVQGGM